MDINEFEWLQMSARATCEIIGRKYMSTYLQRRKRLKMLNIFSSSGSGCFCFYILVKTEINNYAN